MSSYQFFASDTPLREYENPKIKLKADDKSTTLLYSTADESCGMRIILEDDEDLRRRYTTLACSAYIEWNYSEENAKVLIAYIKEHLRNAPRIQLWNAWSGDKSLPQRKKIPANKLKETHILELWGNGFSGRTECLEIYRAYGYAES